MSEESKQDGSRLKYISTLIEVRDRVHGCLIRKRPDDFQTLMMSQNEQLARYLQHVSKSACCLKEINIITPDILSCLAATRYRFLTSISEYEMVNIIARIICEMEIDTDLVTDILFETCMYFYTQKKLMKMLRLSSLEQRIKSKPLSHQKILSWVKQQQDLVFTAEDKDDLLFYSQMPA